MSSIYSLQILVTTNTVSSFPVLTSMFHTVIYVSRVLFSAYVFPYVLGSLVHFGVYFAVHWQIDLEIKWAYTFHHFALHCIYIIWIFLNL